MELWVVAAAAGVGYLAKYLSREREGEGLSERTCPLQRMSGRQLGENATSGRDSAREDISYSLSLRLSEENGSACASATEMASTSGIGDEALLNLGVYEEYNILSLSSLSLGFSGKNNHHKKLVGIDESGYFLSSGERCFYNRYSRSNSLRRRRPCGYCIKPLSSLKNCLVAQLYKEHVEMDEYVFTRISSPIAATVRPLFVTDGKQIISRANIDSYRVQFGSVENLVHKRDETYAEREIVLGVPPLPDFGFVELSKKVKQRRGKGHFGRSSSSDMRVSVKNIQSQAYYLNPKYQYKCKLGLVQELVDAVQVVVEKLEPNSRMQSKCNQEIKTFRDALGSFGRSAAIDGRAGADAGSPNGMLLFCIGIAIGVVSTVMANKRELDRLNEFLKQTENLVQDLQEELEMKDSPTVKELAIEGYESQENNDFSIHRRPPDPFSPQQELTESINCDGKEPYDQKEERSEIMSKIEAELEAELERLELNMCSSRVQRRLSSLLEEELRADMINRVARGQDDSDQDVSGTSTTPTHSANYAVSPRELSLRLHEVIQERLEERLMELEMALQQNPQRMHLLESEGVNSQRDSSNSEIGSSRTHESPTMMEDSNNKARPLVLNLSGDALDAYNEAYEEFMRVTEPEEENPPTTVSNNNNLYREVLHPLDQSEFCHQNRSGQNGSLTHLKIIEDRQSRSLVHYKIRSWEERVSRSRGSSELGDSEEEDEMGKLLIKQIVEKTKQGSPAVLNVQKMLFSMD